MSPAFASPPPAATPRGLFARWWAEPEARSVIIGVAGVIVVHLLLWLLAPHVLRLETAHLTPPPPPAAKQFNIELAPEIFAKAPPPKPPNPFKFLEANPDAPENVPDKADYFSDRNQQLAQEKPNPDGKSDRPATEGKNENRTTQIVDGQLSRPTERMQPAPPAPDAPEEQTPAKPKPLQSPLPGFEKNEASETGVFGSNIARPEKAPPAQERSEGIAGAPPSDDATSLRPVIDRNRPQPRRALVQTSNSRPAFLNKDPGTSRVGAHGANTKWSEYGEYMKRMTEAIYQEWIKILDSRNTFPTPGTFVVVKFILNSEGAVPRIVGVENHSSELGASACVAAITGRAPYGAWPADMKAALGEMDEMTFVFHYTAD